MSDHFLQSNYWKNAKQKLGQSIDEINRVNIFLKPTALGLVGYIPRCNLTEISKLDLERTKAVYTRIDPNDKKKDEDLQAIKHLSQNSIVKLGNPIQLPKTVVVNLSKSLSELKEQMKQKHRYNLKIAEKNTVKVTIGSTQEDFNIFMKLYLDTLKRQAYFGRSEAYLKTIWEEALKENSAFIATAWFGKQPVASWMLLTYKDTVYYPYGGSSEEHRNVMGTYKLVWEIIIWAKEKGYKYFDLYGIEDDQSDGFSRFKVGFVEKDQSQIEEYAQTIDIVHKRFRYTAMRIVENLRNRFKFIKSLS